MRMVTMLGMSALTVAAVAGCAGSGGPAVAGVSPQAAGQAGQTGCAAADLTWQPGTFVTPMTGEHAEEFGLVNHGTAACAVRGYPAAVLYDAAGTALPFRYADGGGMYVTASKPTAVTLKPGATAYVVIAKYRCDRGIKANATSIRLSLPLAGGVAVTRRLRLPVRGAPGMSYCVGGRADPGQRITLSPVEPSQQATRP